MALPFVATEVPFVLTSEKSNYNLGYIADAFYRTGILKDADWNMDLATSLDAALARWVNEECACKQLDNIGIGRFIYADAPFENDHSDEYSGDGYGPLYFTPPETAWFERPNWGRGCFFLMNGYETTRYALGHNCARLNAVQKNLGFIVFDLVCAVLTNWADAITPKMSLERIEEWDMGYTEEDGNPGGFSQKTVLAENPEGIFKQFLKPANFKALKRWTTLGLDRGYDDDAFWAQGIAHVAVDLWEQWRRVQEMQPDDFNHHQRLEYDGFPTCAITWHPGPEDGLARFADDIYQMHMEGDVSAIIEMFGFWIPSPGSVDTSNSIDLAIKRAEAVMKMLGAAENLLMQLESNEPVEEVRVRIRIGGASHQPSLFQSLGIDDIEGDGPFISQL